MPPMVQTVFQSIQKQLDAKMIAIVAGLAVLLVCFYVFVYSIRRSKNKSASGLAMNFGDLDRMKKKGLLTDEELSRVRGALARRLSERESKGRTSVKDLESMATGTLAVKSVAPTQRPQQASAVAQSVPAAPQQSASMSQVLVDLARQGKISQSDLEALRNALNAPAPPSPKPGQAKDDDESDFF